MVITFQTREGEKLMKYNAVTVTQLNKYIKDRFDEDENLNALYFISFFLLLLFEK